MTEDKIKLDHLIEGKSYGFEIRKMIKLSDDQNYYIMIDPFGKKHLMFDKDFINYGFNTGDIIICLVDKINCNGKIFLEPKHPFYVTGKVFEFEFIGIANIESSKKVKQTALLINDNYQSKAVLVDVEQSKYHDFVSRKVKAEIVYIKKAVIYLSLDTLL